MLRLKPFEILFPKDVAEAAALLARHGSQAKICAGGTDLLPNMKHELHEPKVVIHLTHVTQLKGIRENSDHIAIGAMTTLSEIAQDALVRTLLPSLSAAAAHVASPQIRNMGTIGGNICLDTRCLFYNQSYFWRETIGFCLKKCGDTCHVTQTGKRCVAASSNDTSTVLLCLDAAIEIMSSDGIRLVPIDAFYVANGEKNTVLSSGEIVTRVIIPKPSNVGRRRESFAKLRHREAVDFPMLSVGVRFDVDGDGAIAIARLAVNALAAKPKLLNVDWMLGRKPNAELALEAGEFAKARCMPLINIADDPKWRKDMVAVYVKNAIMSSLC